MAHAVKDLEFWIYVLNHPDTGWRFNKKMMMYEFKLAGVRTVASISTDLLEDSTPAFIANLKDRVIEELIAAIN